MLIRDCISDPSCKLIYYILTNLDTKLAYCDNILYVANKESVYLLPCNMSLSNGETKKIELDSTKDI